MRNFYTHIFTKAKIKQTIYRQTEISYFSFKWSAIAVALQIGHKFFIDNHFLIQPTWKSWLQVLNVPTSSMFLYSSCQKPQSRGQTQSSEIKFILFNLPKIYSLFGARRSNLFSIYIKTLKLSPSTELAHHARKLSLNALCRPLIFWSILKLSNMTRLACMQVHK